MRLYGIEKKISFLVVRGSELGIQESLLQKKNAMMRPGSVDKDLLEEQVRRVLGYRDPNEYTVLSN